MAAIVRTDPDQTTQQLRRILGIGRNAPHSLVRIVAAIQDAVTAADQNGVAKGRPRARTVPGPGGAWRVAPFVTHGAPWVGVEWPSGLDNEATKWLTFIALGTQLATNRPETPANQLWIYLGSA